MTTPDRLERLTDLVLVLLHTSTPRTLDEIVRSVPGYPEGHDACRQAFERDKRVLREEGIPVLTEPVEGPEQYGYRIDPDAFFLRDLELEPDEQTALHLAVAGVHLGDPSGRDALAKLGATGVADARPVAALVPPPGLVGLFSALRAQAELRFGYHGEPRVVAPATLRFRAGRWYLIGWDRGRQAVRTFRVDRIADQPTSGPAGSGVPPEDIRAHGAWLEPWRIVEDDEDEQVLVRVDAVEGPRVVAEVGPHAVAEREADGGVLLRLGVTSFDALRSWVLGLLDHAEVVGPPAAREAMVAWLDATMAASASGAPPASRGSRRARPAGTARRSPASAADRVPGQDGDEPPSARRQQALSASARLRRLLAMVAWLADVGEASIREISARFDIAEDEVVHELELAACCGVPPYSPDTLLEIVVTKDTVQAFLPKELARPRRLTPSEGLALAAAARTILAVPGADPDGPLGRALAKLDTVLGDRRQLVIELDAPPLLHDLRSVVDAGVQAEIEYHSASTDETSVRVVEPVALVSLDGHWYLDAQCHRAGDVRRFRVDRIRSLRPLDTPVGERPPAAAPGGDAFVPGPGAALVRLRLDPPARWVADTVPIVEEQPAPGTAVDVTIAVGGMAWLERLLLQLGPHARVVDPPTLAGVGAAAAARLRRRYVGQARNTMR